MLHTATSGGGGKGAAMGEQNTTAKRTIKELRQELRMSQFELAVRSGVSLSAVVNAENGLRMPRVDNAIKIAAALHTTVDEIIWGKPKDN